MIHAHLNEERAVPLWAVVGAPLLGIPLMVALLALVAPVESAPASEHGMQTIEQVEVQHIDRTIEADEDCVEHPLMRS